MLLDKDQPLGRPVTLEEVVGQETAMPRFNLALSSLFGFLGLSLAAVGIYSTLSYSVARRTHEIGIRRAFGARHGDVLRLVLKMIGEGAAPADATLGEDGFQVWQQTHSFRLAYRARFGWS